MTSHPPARHGVRDQVSPPSPLSGPSIPIDGSQEDSMPTKNDAHSQTQNNLIEQDRCQVTINILPDDVLLCIFHEYMKDPFCFLGWHTLVHVCRRWRALVFGSPRYLNVRLYSFRTSVTKTLDMWPAFPMAVSCCSPREREMENVVAAIKRNDRVCEIDFRFRSLLDKSHVEEVVSAMQVPFPALTDLKLAFSEGPETVMVIPDSFLGGSAPSLRRLDLTRISFPGLPKLLLTATHLVSLHLWDLPHSCYISPDAMVTCLEALFRLKSFVLEFESPQSRQDRESRHLPPPTPTLLPALTLLRFKGVHEYAEDLMARIDAPLLRCLYITAFNEAVPNIPHLSHFIYRMPNFQVLDNAHVTFAEDGVRVIIRTIGDERLGLVMLWDESVGRFSSLFRLCRPFLPTLAVVEKLYIDKFMRPHWQEGIQHSHWLKFLRLFTGAKNLYITEDLVPCISPVLRQLVGERTTEVLPALQNLFLYEYWQQKPFGEDIEIFVAARQFSGHPITICSWSKRQYYDWLAAR